jgi:hypothetical protein
MQAEETRTVGAAEMLEDIDWIESKAIEYQEAGLYAGAAGALRTFASWYRHTSRGEDKTPVLQRAVALYDKAITLAPDDNDIKHKLAGILAGLPQVRDYGRAGMLADEILARGRHPLGKALLELHPKSWTPIQSLGCFSWRSIVSS